MSCKNVRVAYATQYYKVNQKLKKVSVLHYSIDYKFKLKASCWEEWWV